jgi:addiction module RelE/StbE family toxin
MNIRPRPALGFDPGVHARLDHLIKNRAHPLKGERKGYWKCHIEPHWLLIYKVTDDEVRLARTGTHADSFER